MIKTMYLSKYSELFENTVPKIDDLVVCIGNVDDLKTHNHIGYFKNGGIQFINRFSDKLHDLGGSIRNNNGWYLINNKWVKIFNNNKIGINIPLIYSNEFKNIISYGLNFLLDYENIFYSDVSFIDLSERSDTISCLSSKSYYKLEKNEDPWTSSMRQNIKIGRFIKKITNDDNKLIEDYTNEYKFSYKLSKDNFGRFKICSGVDISKWYLYINYDDGGGNLKNSCMRHFKSQKRLPIYIKNPDKVKLLYLLSPMDKLMGRALLWSLDKPKNVIYMDKIYYSEEYVEKLFKNYAKKRNFLTKDDIDKNKIVLKVNINGDYGPPKDNPFMDTFKFFVKKGNYLTNVFSNFKMGDYWEYVDHD